MSESKTPLAPDEARCSAFKQGQFAKLRCILPIAHTCEHNFVILGVREDRVDKWSRVKAKTKPRQR